MIEKTILDSGLVVISEYIPIFPSFAMSYTLRGGSRLEKTSDCGIFHMLEHMLFKGTQKYDVKKIADISDWLGGKLNAFTGKEITQYYIKAIDEHLKESFDLLTEMVFNSIFPPDEFVKEKNVAIQEILESDDNPETYSFERFYEKVFKGNGLSYPIGGRLKSVSSFDRDRIYEFYKANYRPENVILAACGKVHHQQLVELANEVFKNYPSTKPNGIGFPTPNIFQFNHKKPNKSLKQSYVIMGFDGLSMVDTNRHQYMLLNEILGAGMSSRLFQRIREELGLSYTVSSFTDAYMDCGIHFIYSIVDPGKTNQYLDTVREEIIRLKEKGISETELKRSKDSLKASIILGLESRVSRMRFHVNNEVYHKRELFPEEILNNLAKSSVEDIDRLFRDYLNLDKMSIYLYGDFGTIKREKK